MKVKQANKGQQENRRNQVNTGKIRSALWREFRLMWIFRRTTAMILILSPVIFSLIPYLREMRGLSELDPDILAYGGLTGTMVYLVFYIIYETMKCERTSKSLEKAAVFWGLGRIVLAKSVVAGGAGLLGGIIFCIFFSAFHGDRRSFSPEILLLTALSTVIFAFLGTALLCVTDSLTANMFLAAFPFLSLTVALLRMTWLSMALLVAEAGLAGIMLFMLRGQVRSGRAGWLR